MQFLTANQVSLINGGYLSNSKTKEPIHNYDFCNAQRKAAFLDKLSKEVEGKSFETVKGECFSQIFEKALTDFNASKQVTYVATPAEPDQKLTIDLRNEALAWIGHQEDKGKTERINQRMQEFNPLVDFEKHGLFFDQGIIKLDKIYTVEEIVGFVTILEPFIGKF